MPGNFKKNDLMRPKQLHPEKTMFSMFSEEEMRKLCVTKICTPMTFDNMGHPLPGGLYDRALGMINEFLFLRLVQYYKIN